MSELFDKEVNAQKEKTSGVHASSCKHEKVCNENETKKQEKNDVHVKTLLMEGSTL